MEKNIRWNEKVKGLLKAELKKRDIGYKELSEKLKELGINEKEDNIKNKLSRGSFSAIFLIQCLTAIECNILRLD